MASVAKQPESCERSPEERNNLVYIAACLEIHINMLATKLDPKKLEECQKIRNKGINIEPTSEMYYASVLKLNKTINNESELLTFYSLFVRMLGTNVRNGINDKYKKFASIISQKLDVINDFTNDDMEKFSKVMLMMIGCLTLTQVYVITFSNPYHLMESDSFVNIISTLLLFAGIENKIIDKNTPKIKQLHDVWKIVFKKHSS
jgi:hypothetical protein